MAGVHTAPADIKLLAQTQLQIIVAACELEMHKKHTLKVQFTSKDVNCYLLPVDNTHNVYEGREKDQNNGNDAHQSAVESGLDNFFRQLLQRNWENLAKRKEVRSVPWIY